VSTESLDEALERVQVRQVDEDMVAYNKAYVNKDLTCLLGWWFVEDENDDRGYFPKEVDALAFRLFLINARLNPIGGRDGH
jgi:hypothetical protein